jgi:isoleucyl-tRNA synthetase
MMHRSFGSKSSLTLSIGTPFGKDMGLISKEIQGFQLIISINWKNGTIEVVQEKNTLTMEDVEISSQDIEGWLVANSNGITVALDIVISQN